MATLSTEAVAVAVATQPAMIIQPRCGLIKCAPALPIVSAMHSSRLVDSSCLPCCAGFVRAHSSETASLTRGWRSSSRRPSSMASSACIESVLNAAAVRRRHLCASPHTHRERNHDASCVPLPPALKPDLLAPDARAPYPLYQLTSGCASSTPWHSQNAWARHHCASRAPFGARRQRWCADARQHAPLSRLLRAMATAWRQSHASRRLMGLTISPRPGALRIMR